MIEEKPNSFFHARSAGIPQCRFASLTSDARIRAVLDQQAHRLRSAVGRGHHQCSLARPVLRVDIRLVLDQ